MIGPNARKVAAETDSGAEREIVLLMEVVSVKGLLSDRATSINAQVIIMLKVQ